MKIKAYKKTLSASENLLTAAKKTGNCYDHNDTFAQVAAYVTAPVIFCYVKDIIQKALALGIKRIYFLARDGYIMKKIADEIIAHNHYDIETVYLYCSRYALKNALYYLCETAEDFESAGLFGRCACQSACNTLSRAGLCEAERNEIYEAIAFTGDENACMDNREFDDFCRRLKNCPLLFEKLKSNSKSSYDNIIAYFEQEGLFEDVPFALADTGWLGSIQSALEKLTENKTRHTVKGFYFGLFKNNDSEKFIPYLFSGSNAHKTVPRFCNNLFECFCAAPHGMTTGYENNGGRLTPVLKEQSIYMKELAEKQTEIIQRFAKEACNINAQPLSCDNVRKLLFSLMYKPDAEEAAALGSFPFCDDATEIYITPLAEKCDGKSLRCLLLPIRVINKAKGRSIYPEKGVYWLYGTIALSGVKGRALYRLSVRLWEKLRLVKEKKNICH